MSGVDTELNAATVTTGGAVRNVRVALWAEHLRTPLNDAAPACNGAAVAAGFAATADPVRPGVTGMNYYGINADRVLYLDPEKSFKEDLPESGGAPHGTEVK